LVHSTLARSFISCHDVTMQSSVLESTILVRVMQNPRFLSSSSSNNVKHHFINQMIRDEANIRLIVTWESLRFFIQSYNKSFTPEFISMTSNVISILHFTCDVRYNFFTLTLLILQVYHKNDHKIVKWCAISTNFVFLWTEKRYRIKS
jgi:hypothetical protein